MSPARRLAIPSTLACAAVLAAPTAALAAEPERTGWWNRLSVGAVAAPQPMTSREDLRIASGPGQPSAYAAVLYRAPGSAAATLDLQLRNVTGTPDVVACPTENTDWPEGGNQPYDNAPPFDCEAGSAVGSVSEDGTTLSFALDTTTQTEPGVWSLALVPSPEAAGLFALDVVKPAPEAFQAEPPEAPEEAGATVDAGATTSPGPGAQGGSGEAFLPGDFAAPSFDTGSTAIPPLVAGGADSALAEAATPAPSVAGGAAPAAVPLLLARPAGVAADLGGGRRLLALLVLAGGSAAVGYAAGQQRPGPRLIGGRSRLGTPAVATTAPAALPAEDRPRGIGRFAKTRDAAPRRLR